MSNQTRPQDYAKPAGYVKRRRLDDSPTVSHEHDSEVVHRDSYSNSNDNKRLQQPDDVTHPGDYGGTLDRVNNRERPRSVEANATLSQMAKAVIEENGFTNQIQVVNERLEDWHFAKDEKFDVIVSEWMGYCLLSEWMLSSVLLARDRFLKPGGQMYPSVAKLFMAPVAETQCLSELVAPWTKTDLYYKVNMSCMEDYERKFAQGKLMCHTIESFEMISRHMELLSLDLKTIKLEQAKNGFKCLPFKFVCYGSDVCYGFVFWFTVDFPGGVTLSTSPVEEETHWQQTIAYVKPFPPSAENHRNLTINIDYATDDVDHVEKMTFNEFYL